MSPRINHSNSNSSSLTRRLWHAKRPMAKLTTAPGSRPLQSRTSCRWALQNDELGAPCHSFVRSGRAKEFVCVCVPWLATSVASIIETIQCSIVVVLSAPMPPQHFLFLLSRPRPASPFCASASRRKLHQLLLQNTLTQCQRSFASRIIRQRRRAR